MIEITEKVARKCLEVVDAGLVSGLGNPVPGQMCVEAAVNFALGAPHGDEPKCVAPTLRSLKIRLNDSMWSSDQARAKGLRRLALAQLGSAGTLDEAEFRKRVVTLAIKVYVPIALRAAASMKGNAAHKDALEACAAACENEPTRDHAVQAREISRTAAYPPPPATAATAYAAAATAAAAAAYAAAAAAYAAATAAADRRLRRHRRRRRRRRRRLRRRTPTADAAAYAYAARDKTLAAFAEDVVQILIDMKAPGCQWLFLTETA